MLGSALASLLIAAAVFGFGLVMLGSFASGVMTELAGALDDLHQGPDHDGAIGPQPLQHREHDREAFAGHEVDQDMGALAQVRLIGRWPEMACLLEDEIERETQRAGDAFAMRGLRPHPPGPQVDRGVVHADRAGEVALDHVALPQLGEEPVTERTPGTGRHWIRLLTDPEGCWGAGCPIDGANDSGLRAGVEGSW